MNQQTFASIKSTIRSSLTTQPPTSSSRKTKSNLTANSGHHIGLELCDTVLKGGKRLGLVEKADDDLWSVRYHGKDYQVDDVVEMLLAGYLPDDLQNKPDDLVKQISAEHYPRVIEYISKVFYIRGFRLQQDPARVETLNKAVEALKEIEDDAAIPDPLREEAKKLLNMLGECLPPAPARPSDASQPSGHQHQGEEGMGAERS